ncbi:putative fungal specific transcription factor [Drepanopeziza brunnea f. sp. 'multigermtubi' MB_m1]|uniref:Putative fungal specific transcription factor n=1 Tax=Marssonina brunnea f. sp. multigermtubi (strain MB_m1) TaxID=1072389 RepID=K1WF23_MARBU|nr:putative fungal specific transcription factor [Drepanopeziza brunnea f. sp. 'multigermtubi' MB_m1]EKD16060.1 putative fungal specific transcription factor [Drepanopeziza brunnea f. sp. 'multigermtubi' MB_m1]
MNIIESQVADLNYLVESPMAAAITTPISPAGVARSMNGQRQSSSVESPAETGNAGGTKRKSDETGTSASANGNGNTHLRAKRNRYISLACNECKRRKIKCNGNTPCQRCGNLNLDCQYAPNCCTNGFKESEEFRLMNSHLAALQEQVDNLYANLNALRAGGDGASFIAPSEGSMSVSHIPPTSPSARYRPIHQHPSFHGPTSSAFSLDVAKNTLHNMGYQGLGVDEGAVTSDATPVGSPPPIAHVRHVSVVDGALGKDPIWALSREEMLRLCRVYEEEMGLMYPILDIEKVMIHGTKLHDLVDTTARTGLANPATAGNGVHDTQSLVLKMVLACATVAEGNGQSEIAYRIFKSVREAADRRLHSEVIDFKSLPFLVLVSIYHFHCDEEALAWRIIGQVARMCIELGLHRRDSLFKVVTDEQERSEAIRLFWSIYVLDRRWSFGTGMPFALQDADIDPNLPEPELSIPYLNVMITYSRIGSKVWKSVCSFLPVTAPALNIEDIGYLDYQILQWQKSIPPELQLPTSNSAQPSSRAIHRLQILLYLRANQMRILIYRPVLHSATSIQDNLQYAETVVELAKDTIRALTHLNQTSDIYRAQQVCFNYFLISALAVVFLASCHASVRFSDICREEFYMALDLVKGFSTKSFVSKRLWKTIKGLKEVGPKLGLAPDPLLSGALAHNSSMREDDAHSSAALAMAGLAGHEISGMGVNGFGAESLVGGTGTSSSPMNGYQMSTEMTHLFEAALGSMGMNGSGNSSGTTPGGGHFAPLGDGLGGVGSTMFGGDEELYRQLKDLF